MHVITVTEQRRVDVAIPETRQHVHAFGGNDFGIEWNLQRTDCANSGNALVFNKDYAVREWVAAKAVDETTTDKSEGTRLSRCKYDEEQKYSDKMQIHDSDSMLQWGLARRRAR
jgi:hypothetical protein